MLCGLGNCDIIQKLKIYFRHLSSWLEKPCAKNKEKKYGKSKRKES